MVNSYLCISLFVPLYFYLCKSWLMQDTSVQKEFFFIFFCIPVSPGSSRLIWSFPRNYGYWIYKLVPRWIFDIKQNLIIDSDLYLLHIEVTPISLYVIASFFSFLFFFFSFFNLGSWFFPL